MAETARLSENEHDAVAAQYFESGWKAAYEQAREDLATGAATGRDRSRAHDGEYEAGLAALVAEALESHQYGEQDADDTLAAIADALTSTGAAEALPERDAEEILAATNRVGAWLRERAVRMAGER